MSYDEILSQSAIDALLDSLPEEETKAPIFKSSMPVENVASTVSSTPPAPPAITVQTNGAGITREQAIEIAGQAAEAESAPIQASMARISKRLGALEIALDRITQLEQEISDLKKAA